MPPEGVAFPSLWSLVPSSPPTGDIAGPDRWFGRIGHTRSSHHILLNEGIPPTTTAHFDDVHLELTERHREHRNLRARSGLPGGGFELVTVDVVDMREVLPAADGAP